MMTMPHYSKCVDKKEQGDSPEVPQHRDLNPVQLQHHYQEVSTAYVTVQLIHFEKYMQATCPYNCHVIITHNITTTTAYMSTTYSQEITYLLETAF